MSKPPPLPLEEAQARLLTLAPLMPIERVDVESAVGRYLAEPLIARRTQPSADLSAMDGYAVAPDDLAGPWQVIGESAAGHPFAGAATRGKAVRISTGAVLPQGAGAVILQEDLARAGDSITLTGDAPTPQAKHIRLHGMDFTAGAQVLDKGVAIGPAQVALAIASGHRHVAVRRRPRVTVIDSGDELAADCENCLPHQIPASNGAMLASLAASVPCEVERLGPVADNLDALAGVLSRASHADVVVTSGGASVGEHDLIRPALEAYGAQLDFWRVAIKPGKPILVATRDNGRGRQMIIGLPGNPVSSHVTAFFFVLPLMRAMLGATEPLPMRLAMRLAGRLGPGGSRREFVRGHWNGAGVLPHTLQDSGALSALAASNVLIDRDARAQAVEPGGEVWGYLLANGGSA